MKNNSTSSFVLFFLFFFLSTVHVGCSGKVYVVKHKDLDKGTVRSLVTLEPDFEYIQTRRLASVPVYEKSLQKEDQFTEMLRVNARKAGVDLRILDADKLDASDANYFILAQLKKEILQTVSGLDIESKAASNEANIPEINTRFSYLEDVFGTPFFAVHGVTVHGKPSKGKADLLLISPPFGIASFFQPNMDTQFFTVIVNVATAQIVYREVRKIHDAPTNSNLNSIIYDSFKSITR
jgi:hypothetical protein